MTPHARPTFFHRFLRGRERWRGDELADMGTAFGLDQAYGEAVGEGHPEPAAARSTVSIGSWRSWLGRKPAA
jgi:hypothetical protein